MNSSYGNWVEDICLWEYKEFSNCLHLRQHALGTVTGELLCASVTLATIEKINLDFLIFIFGLRIFLTFHSSSLLKNELTAIFLALNCAKNIILKIIFKIYFKINI